MTQPPDLTAHRSPWWGLSAFAALTLALVSSWVLQSAQYRSTPNADWINAALHIRQNFQEGDVVRVHPHWNDNARVFLPGLPFDTPKLPDPDTLSHYKRLWVLTAQDHTDDLRALLPGATELDAASFGEAQALLFEVGTQNTFEATRAIHLAKVKRTYPDRPAIPCERWEDAHGGGAWHCGAVDPFLYVGARYREMDGEARRCVFAPPAPEGGWSEVTFEGVTAGAALRGRVGLSDESTRSDRGSHVDVEVLINQDLYYNISLPPQDPTYHRFSVDTQALQGQTVAITFRFRAANLLDRFPCFEAFIPKNP